MSHCAVCCESFTGTEAGDMHRVGDHNDRDPLSPDRRRCLTPAEMRTSGLGQNDRGHWQRTRPDRDLSKAPWTLAGGSTAATQSAGAVGPAPGPCTVEIDPVAKASDHAGAVA